MIDSHCHLADQQFAHDLDAVIERAVAAGAERMMTIADSLEESEKCVTIAEKYAHIFCSVGVHPHQAKEWPFETTHRLSASPQGDILGELLRVLVFSSRKIVALGEMGLDYHYDFSPRDVQRQVFREQLELAKELQIPAVVHCRKSLEDVWAIVDAVRPEKLVFHCCTERWEDVRRFIERGYLLSFTGIATYPKSEEVRRTIQMCPLTQLMVETDAPYLPPDLSLGAPGAKWEALRAKGGRWVRNEPAYVMEVAKCVATVKGVSLDDVDRVTTENAVGFFGLP